MLLTTATWVRENWGEFKKLIERDELVAVSSRGRPVAVGMAPSRWSAMAAARGLNPENVVRQSDSASRQSLAKAWRDAAAGVATISEDVYGGLDTAVFAPMAVLDDDAQEACAREAKERSRRPPASAA